MIQNLSARYHEVEERILAACTRAGRNRNDITLITVTKTFPTEVLQQVIDSGHAHIGENKVQEMCEKVPDLTGTRVVHLIGHLQSNKVTKAVQLAHWIHSLDSIRLIDKVDSAAQAAGVVIQGLIQVNTSHEDAKSGCDYDELLSLCEHCSQSKNISLRGLMTIGPLSADAATTRSCFKTLRTLGETIKKFLKQPLELSMGMSGDFESAIEEGATMIRIGSLLLGHREYK